MGFDDYVADINAYTKGETLIFSVANREVVDALLELRCSPNRLDRAPKLCQEPVAGVFYARPPCCAIDGSTASLRSVVKRACVASSSSCIRREYPATSAANIADNLRSIRFGRSCTMAPARPFARYLYYNSDCSANYASPYRRAKGQHDCPISFTKVQR
jgi:hypothetical protein